MMATSLPTPTAPPDEVELPEPGQTFIPGTALKTVKFGVTTKTTKADLQRQLRTYGLPANGNKTKLLEVLREFSRDRDAWLSLFQPQKKRKRGVHNSRTSLSTKRIAEQFGDTGNEQVISYKSKKSVDRVQRALNDGDRASNNAWANAMLSALGINKDLTEAPSKRRRTEHSMSSADCSNMDSISCPTTQSGPQASGDVQEEILTVKMRHVERGLFAVNERFSNFEDVLTTHILELRSSLQPPPPVNPGDLPHSHVAQPMATISAQSESSPTPTPFTLASTASVASHVQIHDTSSSIHPDNVGIAHLDDSDTEFVFDISRVPDPPAINFSDDIDRLFREWESSMLLVVNGRGIPVKHWGQFYKKVVGAKEAAWDALKSKWGKWKFIVSEREKYSDDEEFWRHFSDENGQRLCYQQILDRIHNGRITSTAEDAANARLFFGGNLNHPSAHGAFRYLRTGKSYLRTKDAAVSKAWHKLLATRPDIAAQWDALCAVRLLAIAPSQSEPEDNSTSTSSSTSIPITPSIPPITSVG
ncbi:hypothetical protein BU15DRAFT_67163 [Melanogaster broomeanus]|nr:hypothetical protein BU15DRAFT_67163 [Melanogaster broomeanus]